jgi:hypothetical protein
MKIAIDHARMGAVAGFLEGHLLLDGHKIRFKGVAFGRYGGQNVRVEFSPGARRALKKRGIDPDELASRVQQKIVQGDFEVVQNPSAGKDG